MAKNKIEIDVKVDDKGTTKKVGLEAKKTGENLGNLGKSAGEADRNLKGAAQTSANSTKNFSKMSQGMGGLVAVYATLAAQVFAVTAAYQFLSQAVDYKNLIEGQKALGAVTGVAYKTISNSIIDATNGQLKYAEAAKAAAIGTASGLSPSQLERLGAAAKNASIALGRDLADSFDRLVRGVTKAEPELLDELGIILRLDTATRKYGAQIGKAANTLNEFERSQAVANEVLEQAERKFGAMEKLMDPTSAALNQFGKAFNDIANNIKEIIAGPIAAIATFLSEHIYALAGSLSLFAASILKQILPSMTEWRAASQAARIQNQKDQEAIRAQLALTRIEYEKLNATQLKSMEGAAASSATILAGTSSSKTGQGAFDFLTGGSDTKKAQMAADKALTHAENQLKQSLEKRTGMLAKYSAEEIAELRQNYNLRAGIIAEGEVTWGTKLKKMRLNWAKFRLDLKSGAIGLKDVFAKLGGGLAFVGSALSKLFFWTSIISIVVSAGKYFFDFMNPATEAQKKLNEETEKSIERYKSLTEEISRTNNALREPGLLNASEIIQATGKAVASLDISKVIKDINELDPKAEKYDELRSEIAKTLAEAAKLDPKFKGIIDSFEKGTPITQEAAQGYNALANAMIQAGINSERLPSLIQATEAELSKLIGTFEKPFAGDFLASASKSIPAMEEELKNLRKTAEAQAEIIQKARAAATSQKVIPVEDRREGGPTYQNVFAPTPEQQTAINEAYKRYAESFEAIKAINLQLQFQTILSEKLRAKAQDIAKLRKDENDAAVDAAKKRTLGRNLAEKLANIEADGLVLAQKANGEKEKLIVLEAKRDTLAEQLGKEENKNNQILKDQLKEVKSQIVLQEGRVSIAEADVALGEERNRLATTAVNLESDLLALSRERLGISKGLAAEQLRLQNIQAGGTGEYGFSRAASASAQQGVILGQRQADAQKALEMARKTRQETDKNNTAAMLQADTQVANAEKVLNSIQQEIDLYNQRNQLILLGAKADTEYAQARVQTLSLNPVAQQFNEKMVELRKEGYNLTVEEQKLLYAEIESQNALNEIYNAKSKIFDSISSNITSAFSSIIDGTKSAKQAFADMAIAILSDISQMITRMLIMRALMSAFGPTFSGPDMGATSGMYGNGFNSNLAYGSAGAFTRYGGIVANGKNLPGYATGGIAKGPDAGYPVIMHGTEAVVPLPNGRSIPVEMKGAGQNNNVVVNVSVDGQGNGQSTTESQSGADAANLGRAIAQAVQQELQNQKRSGGILNPYGVA